MRRTECTGIPATSAPLAPGNPVLVASGLGGIPFRAAAISWAVRVAVPDGAAAEPVEDLAAVLLTAAMRAEALPPGHDAARAWLADWESLRVGVLAPPPSRV